MRFKIHGVEYVKHSLSSIATMGATAGLLVLSGCGQDRTAANKETVASQESGQKSAEVSTRESATPSLASLPAPYSQADYSNGKAKYNQCIACHALTEGRNGLGPHLHGLLDRKAGSIAGYGYSDKLRQSGIVWDAASLDQWIENPRKFLPGTRMNYAGMRGGEDRRDLIAYIMVSAQDSPSIPTP